MVTLIEAPVVLTCKKAATLNPKEHKTKKLPIKPVTLLEKVLRPSPFITKPTNGNKGISQMYLSI